MKIGLQITKNDLKYEKLLSTLKNNLSIKRKIEFIHIKDDTDLSKTIDELNILVCYHIEKEIFIKATNMLQWIHCGTAGVEHIMYPEIIKSKVIITNARGIHATPIAEYVLGVMLYLAKQFDSCQDFKNTKNWNQWSIVKNIIQLKGKTIGIIGFGSLGKEIARLAKSFGMKVNAIRRLQKKIETKKIVDRLMPMKYKKEIFCNSDFVVVACPLTPLTRNMIGANEFKMMSNESFFINISRGGIVDESALLVALETNQISGAALDVFNQQPLNLKHKLFTLKNVFLSPHISGNFPEYQNDMIVQFAHNLTRYVEGKGLRNRVCKKRLY